MKILKSFPGIALLIASLFFSENMQQTASASEQAIPAHQTDRGINIAREVAPEAIRESFQGLDGKMLEEVLEDLPPIDRMDWDIILDAYESLLMVESAI